MPSVQWVRRDIDAIFVENCKYPSYKTEDDEYTLEYSATSELWEVYHVQGTPLATGSKRKTAVKAFELVP